MAIIPILVEVTFTDATWSVTFDLRDALQGKATLRLAFAATSVKRLAVTINDKLAGEAGPLQDTATIRK